MPPTVLTPSSPPPKTIRPVSVALELPELTVGIAKVGGWRSRPLDKDRWCGCLPSLRDVRGIDSDLLTPAARAHRALGCRDIVRGRGVVLEHDANTNSASENDFGMGDLTLEPGHCGNIDGDATAGKLRWRRWVSVTPRPSIEISSIRHRRSPGSPSIRQTPSQPARSRLTRRLYVTANLLPDHRVPGPAGAASWSASDHDLFL